MNMKKNQLLFHRCNANADGALVSVQSFNRRQGLDCLGQTKQTFRCQVRAGDVLEEGAKVDSRVLLGVAVGCCFILVDDQVKYGMGYIRNEWLTPAE